MRRILACSAVALVPMAGVAMAQQPPARPHTIVAAGALTWGDPPPIFERGMSFTVLSGDPSQKGMFVVRLRMPEGYTIAPHWHPTDEHVTVLSGTLYMGLGDKLDTSAGHALPAGGFAVMPQGVHHFAWSQGETIIQVHAVGPWGITYINPADDPWKDKAK